MAETSKGSSSGGNLVNGDWSENLVSQEKRSLKCPNAMDPIGICMHNTANNASAANEISYMRNNDSSTSYHFCADEKSAIQGLPLDRNGWHAGDGKNGQGNRKHIGIEIARSTDYSPGVFEAAERKSAALAAKLCQRFGWGVDQIKAHRDFASKNCPHRTSMKAFKNLVSLALQGKLYDNTPVTEDGATTTATSKPAQNNSKPAESTPATAGSVAVGSKVKVTGSKYATGQTVPSWVKNNTYTVSSVSGSKCLLKEIVSWVYAKDLQVIGGAKENKSEAKDEKKAEPKTEAVAPATSKAYVTCDVLNVRDGAGVKHNKLGTVTKGMELKVSGESNGWLKIQYGSGTGWVCKDYTTTKAPAQNNGQNAAPAGGAVSASGVPLFSQSDPLWGSDLMGKSGKTIRQIGCAMTSTTMTLNKISGQSFTPKVMNSYLNKVGGYTASGAIYWNTAAQYVGKTYTGKSYTRAIVDGELNAGRPVVVSVKGAGHWVCVAGRNADGTYIIHDPAGGKVLQGSWNKSYVQVGNYSAGSYLRTFG